jgi:hypothetical protein
LRDAHHATKWVCSSNASYGPRLLMPKILSPGYSNRKPARFIDVRLQPLKVPPAEARHESVYILL